MLTLCGIVIGNAMTALLTHPAVLDEVVMMALVKATRAGIEGKSSMDQWPGYAHERISLMRFIADRKIPNPVVLTGDIHSNWANELRIDDREHDTPVVATELVGTSISSGGNGIEKPDYLDSMKAANPVVKFHTQERGYVRCTLTPAQMRADYVAVEDVLRPGGKVLTRASFVIESGRPQLNPA